MMTALLLRLSALGALGLVGVALTPTTVMAQDDPTLTEKLNGAMEDYDLLELEAAESKLMDAIEHANSNGLSGPQLAKVYVMLGIIQFANGDEDGTKNSFIAALETYGQAQVPAIYETPELAKIMEDARKVAKVPENNGGNNANGGSGKFEHKAVTRAEGGKPQAFEVFVPETMPVFRVTLYHRRFGEAEFVETEMKPTSATVFSTTLPGDQVSTSQIDYYIVAYDRAGKELERSVRTPHPSPRS